MDDAPDFNTMFEPEELHPDLKPYLETLETLGMPALRHPLVYSVPHSDSLNKMVNMRYEHISKAVQDALLNGDMQKYIFMHEKPWRFHAFQQISDGLSDELYSECLGTIWTNSENIAQNLSEWIEAWTWRHPIREHLMNAEEISYLTRLPDRIRVHRGTGNLDGVNGLSWTLNRQKAVWFARRYRSLGHEAVLASGSVNKQDVLAYFSGRGEDEIVVLPENVQDLKTRRVVRAE